jgi:uncharacterized membrane protein YccF (DUF307 family)
MSTLGNVIWVVFGGFFVCLEYLLAGFSLCLTVVGIPFGVQLFKLGIMALLPFGQEAVPTEASEGAIPLIANVVWLVVWGWVIALSHVVFAALFAVTVVGIPFALQHWKLAKLALWPFGKEITSS